MIAPLNSGGERILVVDDMHANAQLLMRMVHGAGYTRVRSTTRFSKVCALPLNTV